MKKTLRLKAVPSIHLPEKLHQKQLNKERRHINIVKDIVKPQNTTIYKSFKGLCNRVKRIRLQSWVKEECERCLKLSLLESPYRIPKLEILFQNDMSYTCVVFGWLLPESHIIYTKFHRSVENVTVSELLGFITSYDLCNGLDIKQLFYPDSVMNHVIPCELDLNLSRSLSMPQNVKELKRENGCCILVSNNDNPCPVCSKCIKKLDSKFKKQNINENRTCKPNALLSKTNPNRIRRALMQQRLKCA